MSGLREVVERELAYVAGDDLSAGRVREARDRILAAAEEDGEDDLFPALYQLAGERLLMVDELTEGQRARLTELLLDALSEPLRFTAETLANLHRAAKLP